MTTHPDTRADASLARFIVETRARINAQYDEELSRAAQVLEQAKAMHDAAKAAYRKIEDESARRRTAEANQLLDAIVEAAQRLLAADAEPTGAVEPAADVSTESDAPPPASVEPVAPDVPADVPRTVEAAPPAQPPRQVQGGAVADPKVAVVVEHLVGPTLASDPGVRPPRVGDKVRMHAGGIGEISDAMMGIASIKDGPTLKYTALIQAAPGSDVQWTEKLIASATTTATAPPVHETAAPVHETAPPVQEPTTTATDGKERRKCERCGTEALVLQSGQLRGHLTPEKKRCAPVDELAHEIQKTPKGDEPPAEEWPSSATQQDAAAKSLF